MNDIVTQYRIIAAGAGWIDKTARGRLRFDGADRTAFLQALLTNEIAALAPHAGTYALYLTPQGRMIADLHVFIRPDVLVADVPAADAASLAEALDRLIFTEDVRVTDVSRAFRQISVLGGGAAGVLSRALGIEEEALRQLPAWAQLDVDAAQVNRWSPTHVSRWSPVSQVSRWSPGSSDPGMQFVARTDDADEGSWDVWIDPSQAAGAIADLENAGATHATEELAEALRIDAGRPRFGVDMTNETIPLEAGLLERAISQTKGCYVGQEVIVRVLHRGGGRVAKRLVRLTCTDADLKSAPAAGAAITADGKDVGRVTSAAFSPRAGRIVALGYVHRDAAEVGRALGLTWPEGRSDAVITGMTT